VFSRSAGTLAGLSDAPSRCASPSFVRRTPAPNDVLSSGCFSYPGPACAHSQPAISANASSRATRTLRGTAAREHHYSRIQNSSPPLRGGSLSPPDLDGTGLLRAGPATARPSTATRSALWYGRRSSSLLTSCRGFIAFLCGPNQTGSRTRLSQSFADSPRSSIFSNMARGRFCPRAQRLSHLLTQAKPDGLRLESVAKEQAKPLRLARRQCECAGPKGICPGVYSSRARSLAPPPHQLAQRHEQLVRWVAVGALRVVVARASGRHVQLSESCSTMLP